jgi:hypothetical protein
VSTHDKDFKLLSEAYKSLYEDSTPGGLADKHTPATLALKHGVSGREINAAIAKGTKVEMEHTDSKEQAREIAMDHIFEDPKYYDKLETIENH